MRAWSHASSLLVGLMIFTSWGLGAPGCKSGEPATPAGARPITAAEAGRHAEPEPKHETSGATTAEALVDVELGLVDAGVRDAIAARLGPSSPLVTAEAVLAIRYTIAKDWHIYWQNPGESGLRTRVEVEAVGATPGELVYPAPERLVAQGGQVTYGWGEAAVLFVPLSARSADAGVVVETRYLVCRESCIPGEAKLEATLGALPTRGDPTTRAMAARIPEPADGHVHANWADGRLLVRARDESTEIVELFPYASDVAVLGTQARDGEALVLHYRFSQTPGPALAQGVLHSITDGEPRWLELAVPWPGA